MAFFLLSFSRFRFEGLIFRNHFRMTIRSREEGAGAQTDQVPAYCSSGRITGTSYRGGWRYFPGFRHRQHSLQHPFLLRIFSEQSILSFVMNASDPESIQFLRNQRARIQFFSITQPTPGRLFCSSVVREAD